VGEAATAGTGDVAAAGVGVGEAFVSSAREVVPLADKRTMTVPARANERIFVTQFNIVWVGFLIGGFWLRHDGTGLFYLLKKPQRTTGRFITGVCPRVLAVLVPIGNTSGDPWLPAMKPPIESE
jgi:hypothetical protein